jgi:hypothetical protein
MYIVPDGWMANERHSEKDREESDHGLIKTLSQNLHGQLRKTTKNLVHYSWCPDKISTEHLQDTNPGHYFRTKWLHFA